MSAFHSTYAFYGVHVPEDQWMEHNATDESERVSSFIRALQLDDDTRSVGYVTAGPYDRDMLFLCVTSPGQEIEVPLGEFRSVPAVHAPLAWRTVLMNLADALGYVNLGEPGWITVPSLD